MHCLWKKIHKKGIFRKSVLNNVGTRYPAPVVWAGVSCPNPIYMPAIDLARLRKQANRLADFFFLPDEFMKHLHQMLDFYVNYTLRTKENAAPGSNLKTYRTPPAVLTHIENELRQVAENNPHFALELADILWDEGALETRLLAAFLLGRIPPQEERLLPRLTAWTQQVRDPSVRSALLSTSLTRMRKESPAHFLTLIREYFHPARARTWSNGIQALLPMIADTSYTNLPPILDIVEPIIEEAPSTLQNDLAELIVALYRASANETTFMLKNILAHTQNPMTAITLRRISPSLPPALQNELHELLRPGSQPLPAQELTKEDIKGSSAKPSPINPDGQPMTAGESLGQRKPAKTARKTGKLSEVTKTLEKKKTIISKK